MALSREAIALRKSNVVFKRGVDPDNVIAVLYSKLLLTPEERARATQRTLTADQQLDVVFECQERRVSAESSAFHELVQVLRDEPALEPVGQKMQDLYDAEPEVQSKDSTPGGAPAGQRSAKDSTPGAAPGGEQRSAKGMQMPELKDLIADVVTTKWYELGLQLTNDETNMNVILSDHGRSVKDALKATFNLWLNETSDPTPSWWGLVDALRCIKENRLAMKIEKKYC